LILVTGATGFVGSALSSRLALSEKVRATARQWSTAGAPNREVELHTGELSAKQDWGSALEGVTCVIHCAARVHVMREQAVDPLVEFRRVNVEGTMRLARQAAESGVRRLVFVSSIKVNGEWTEPGTPYRADDHPNPQDPYGMSKCEAEVGLRSLAQETGMEVVIIRPPLVYGPGVKANFLAMLRWLERGVPLPLSRVSDNRRSLVFLGNLVDLIVTCIEHPAAASQTLLVSDDEDLSTAELLRRMGLALGRPVRLFPVPPGLLRLGASLIGRPEIAQRLCGSLQVDISRTKEVLGWRPPFSVDEGLKRTAEAYLASRTKA